MQSLLFFGGVVKIPGIPITFVQSGDRQQFDGDAWSNHQCIALIGSLLLAVHTLLPAFHHKMTCILLLPTIPIVAAERK